jgi:hypothetical protein
MNTTIESIPATWNDERDGQFFRVTASLFPQSFCYGASVLLSSYDAEDLTHYDVVDAATTAEVKLPSTATSEISITTDATPHPA